MFARIFFDVDDDFDIISETEEEECVDCSKFSVIKVNSLTRSVENTNSTSNTNNDSSLTTCNNVTHDSVDIEHITKNQSDFDDVSNE